MVVTTGERGTIMQKLEYLRVVARGLEQVKLDDLGDQGWELAYAEERYHSTTYVFCRPKQDADDNG